MNISDMKIGFSKVNNAWVLMFGDTLLDLDGVWFWETREALESALGAKGIVMATGDNLKAKETHIVETETKGEKLDAVRTLAKDFGLTFGTVGNPGGVGAYHGTGMVGIFVRGSLDACRGFMECLTTNKDSYTIIKMEG